MTNRQLNYFDLDYLTQDTIDNSLIVEACQWFLQHDTTEDARLYAIVKVKNVQSHLSGIPDLGGLQAIKDLIALADERDDYALQTFSRAKAIFVASDIVQLRSSHESGGSKEDMFQLISDVIGCSVQDEDEFRRTKPEQYCKVLGRVLDLQNMDVASAIEVAKHTRIPEGDPKLISFVAVAVGLANEISRTDLDEGYQILSNVSVQTPGTMHPRIFAIMNRLLRYATEHEESAIQQAKQVVKEVLDFCNVAVSSEDDSEYARFAGDLLRRKKDAFRVYLGEIDKLIESTDSQVVSTSRIKAQIADVLDRSKINTRAWACTNLRPIAELATL
ncbi:MAG: hypothetical protein GPJ17_05690 [Microcystis aeruginosa K13-07]|jgi:hypothetical protein|nr:hypothetical protein [Microcystis aeruginosa K13-07]